MTDGSEAMEGNERAVWVLLSLDTQGNRALGEWDGFLAGLRVRSSVAELG